MDFKLIDVEISSSVFF